MNVDRLTPMLLPPDLRDWVPAGHIVHLILDAGSLCPATGSDRGKWLKTLQGRLRAGIPGPIEAQKRWESSARCLWLTESAAG